MTLSRTHQWVAGLAIIGLANAVALLGAAYNRSDTPESMTTLSERELWPMSEYGSRGESSALDLRLRWRTLDATEAASGGAGFHEGSSPKRFDEEKMRLLGFDTSLAVHRVEGVSPYERQLPRNVLVVLELDGETYRQSLAMAEKAAVKARESGDAERAKRAADALDEERRWNSRLFAVDAGLEVGPLREKYADRGRYVIVSGQVRPASGGTPRRKTGYVSGIDAQTINVPLQWRDALKAAVLTEDYPYRPKGRYEVTVAFGARLEPWIVTAKPR